MQDVNKMTGENVSMDTYGNTLLQDDDDEAAFVSEEDDPSDFRQYKTSRRRQFIFKLAIVGVVAVLLVIIVVYFTKLRPKDDGTLKACEDGQPQFQELPAKCFSVRVRVRESISYVDTVEACKRECLSFSWCNSVDFFSYDGECYTFSILSSEAPNADDFVDTRGARHGVDKETNPTRLHSCSHYDKVCL